MILINFHPVPVTEVEQRVIARLEPGKTIIEQASHIYPDAQFGETLNKVHDTYLAAVRDLDSMPEIEVEFDKVSRDFDNFWFKVKLVFSPSAKDEVTKALKDNDIELIDAIK